MRRLVACNVNCLSDLLGLERVGLGELGLGIVAVDRGEQIAHERRANFMVGPLLMGAALWLALPEADPYGY